MKNSLKKLAEAVDGEFHVDDLYKSIYATDASVYREKPIAVCFPKHVQDLKTLIEFAAQHQIGLIPRTAGTSLAGQCVGSGIVVDVSRYFNRVLHIDPVQRIAVVQPGVIRDDLNRQLAHHGLFFGPNTSTSNRCMIGGMAGNNSSGTTSIRYGTTRDKLISMKTLLSDGSEVNFGEMTAEEFMLKREQQDLEGNIYRQLFEILSPAEVQLEILDKFPDPAIHRRNTGYAVDEIITTNIFNPSGPAVNMCRLLSGSEGTLAFTTELTLQLDKLPPKYTAMVAAHFTTIESCMLAVAPSMESPLYTCEMMDKVILDCTKQNLMYRENRFFIEGDPKAILMLELRSASQEDLQEQLQVLLKRLEGTGLAYACPVLMDEQIDLALELRKAGLGLLGNMVGDRKAVACIEDTAVALPNLANYILEFTKIMAGYGQDAVYYAHAGAGELHLRPILDLKKKEDVLLFRKITEDVAQLVKKYRGSLSGEHGDGRLRAEFIEFMIGPKNYRLLKEVKKTFDPHNIFNPGKIVDAAPMDTSLRYAPGRIEPAITTLMNFDDSEGILRLAEKCNGSGDCRKSVEAGGTMCPSYRATKDEKDTTRARANALREFLTNSEKPNKFDHEELKEVLDLCISCKGCKSECPSNVDMAALKAEFQYQYQKANGKSLRSRAFVGNAGINSLASNAPEVANFFFSNILTSTLAKKAMGIARERSLPLVSKQSLSKYHKKHRQRLAVKEPVKTVYLFNDEFTNYQDTAIGIDALELLSTLGYQVNILQNKESGRSHISKGFLEEAKELANRNIELFKDKITAETPLIGIEPSAILGFRDEYLRLANDLTAAEDISRNTFLIEEFLKKEMALGNIIQDSFTSEEREVKIHVHCHQKAMSNSAVTFDVLNFPKNYKVRLISSGCCGMAGSFGYEAEHYEVSMKIGEQSLFPAVRNTPQNTIVAANGTSCRHQILDGTGRTAKHPVTVLREALHFENAKEDQ
ncbi:FAD-binding protein [Antarcticibacterium flavum]|uniref:FAD-binding protein n=1 Tax=Antarcticibacterium flavum TaxID=2058175 RepID=A0A5B7WYS3_9FLAO|nr:MULTISPECIES: FAD-binding and (Fe-S)-binding domain-containing protein [Antarcticibacterium]MCM4158854.1 FAD-binding oxidoreductase [Antarcticibacterium sp. W02-3]QCY68115.1 FAD-binding protein [Antarcticibacterium flavum]